MERELRKAYLQWLAGIDSHQDDLNGYINTFDKKSRAIIAHYGGHAASLGALADFPVPKTLELSPVANVVYDQMKQAAIKASITAGLNSKDAARQMLHVGLDTSYRRLERLARTETVSAYWKNQWDSVADLPLIVMVWSSEESHRTCDWCISRDGLVVEDSNIRDHPNGRCTLIPTLRSAVQYKGTLQPDGSVDMDPRWAQQRVAGAKAQASAGPTTEEQRDPLSGKTNPAAPSQALPVHASQGVPTVEIKTNIKPAAIQPVHAPAPRVIKTMKDMDNFATGMPVPSTLTPKAAQVLDEYAKGTAYTANAVLRGQKTFRGRAIDARTKTYTKGFTKDMDKMMDASVIPEDVRVVRAVQADAFGGIDKLQELVGGIYQDKGYMSTSLAEKVNSAVYNVKDAIDMEITVPKGTRAVYMAGESYLRSERELLLDRGTRLAVQSVTYDERTKKWKLVATVLPGPR
jgi:hypothetical protein